MIEKIHLTAMIFSAISYLIITMTKSEDLKMWFMAIVLIVLGASLSVVVGLALWRIWA